MFKAKLIEDPKYYHFRRIKVLLYFLPAIPIGFLVNYYNYPIWITLLAILTYILVLVVSIRSQKRIKAYSQNQIIELEDNFIRVKSSNTPAIEINLDNVDKISIPAGYGIPEESFKDITNELTGNAKKNFIILSKGTQNQRFDFVIESYYMLQKFDNLVQAWTTKGYSIERL